MQPRFRRSIAIVVVVSGTGSVFGQSIAARRRSARPQRTYEDREIKVVIPAGWKIVPDAALKEPGGPGMSLGNSISGAHRKLILAKKEYTLGIAYNTDHASGIVGGRFIEIFNIPWPGMDDIWNCSMYLGEYPQPASRNLIFVNLIVDSGDEKVRANCPIQTGLGKWTERDGQRTYQGERRWFGGYFRATEGGYFFGGNGADCGLKAYTLTSQATSPNELPDAGNPILDVPELKRVIGEAIDIVNSIHYKRCSPF